MESIKSVLKKIVYGTVTTDIPTAIVEEATQAAYLTGILISSSNYFRM